MPNTPSGDGPCLQFSNKKEERVRRARFKSSKFEVPRDYEAAELEEELGPLCLRCPTVNLCSAQQIMDWP